MRNLYAAFISALVALVLVAIADGYQVVEAPEQHVAVFFVAWAAVILIGRQLVKLYEWNRKKDAETSYELSKL